MLLQRSTIVAPSSLRARIVTALLSVLIVSAVAASADPINNTGTFAVRWTQVSPVFAGEKARANGADDVSVVPGDADVAPASLLFLRRTNIQDAAAREIARPGFRPARSGRGAAAQTSPTGSWVARHPVWTGVLIGAAGGAAVGMASCRNAPEFTGLCVLAGSGIGGGAGGVVGLVLTRR